MKNTFLTLTLAFGILCSPPYARADLFGADVGVLTQILAQAIMQLAKLREILGTAQDNLNLLREINQGINDSLNLLHSLNPNLDPGIYKDWTSPNEALKRLQAIYGVAADSLDAQVQKNTDQSVAEAITYSNSLYQYSAELDGVAEQIKSASHYVSPGGAQKLTAQALGLTIQALNQNLRAQATALKVSALSLANENKKNKDEIDHFSDANRALKDLLRNEKIDFEAPRF